MIVYCTRCRLPLDVPARPGQTLTVTCPSCLALMTVQRPAPIPAIPIEGSGGGDEPLGYRGITGDVEAELQKDQQFAIWGIVAFGVMGVIGYFALKMSTGLPGDSIYWLGWIGGVTAFIAMATLARHAKRGRQVRSGAGNVRMKTTGERVTAVIVLGISGLLLIVLTFVAALVLLLAACFAVMSMGGMR